MRRHLFFRVGLRQAAALAAPQSRKARRLRHRLGTLRHGGGRAVRHRRRGRDSAQHLRHGPQMDVERRARRLPAGRILDRCRSTTGRRARKAGGPLSDFRQNRRPSFGGVGGKAGTAGGHPDSRGGLRRALGRHRRGRAPGRRGQRGGDLHLHHGHQRTGRTGSRSMRRGAGLDRPGAYRHRGGPFRHRRYLRSGGAARRDYGGRTIARPRPVSRRRDRPAAPHLG